MMYIRQWDDCMLTAGKVPCGITVGALLSGRLF